MVTYHLVQVCCVAMLLRMATSLGTFTSGLDRWVEAASL